MAGERTYTQIPPRSTGDRISQIHIAHDGYTGFSGTWQLGKFYTIAGLGGDNTIHLHGFYDEGGGTGTLTVHLNKDARWQNLSPTVGANINDPDGATVATVTSFTNVYIPAQNVVGFDNPQFGWDIDRFGSGQVTFAEGQPQVDAFGKLRSSGGTIIGDYIFANDTLPALFSGKKTGAATITWESTSHNLLITNTTASGDRATYTSNTYHHYIPGSSHLYIATMSMSAGQTNLVRNWGMFDAEDGFMFAEIDGTFGVQTRTNVSGSVVNQFIPQSDFNQDTCDGSSGDNNPSTFGIDLTKNNTYWIDMQGDAGRVRFGTFSGDGERIVMHEIEYANTLSTSQTTSLALPVCYVQRNATITYDISVPDKKFSPSGYANATIGSTAEFRSPSAGVWTEVDVDLQALGRNALVTKTLTIASSSSTSTNYYICSLSPEKEITAGDTNHSLYFPLSVDVLAYDASGNDARVELSFFLNPPLSGKSYSPVEPYNPTNTVEFDTSATFYDPANGTLIYSTWVNGQKTMSLLDPNDSMFSGAFKNYSENGGTTTTIITNITAASTAVITANDSSLPFLRHRENGEPLVLDNVVGTIGDTYNGTTVYVKVTGEQTAELYTNASLTTPLDTSGLTYTSGGTLVGDFGTRIELGVVAKPITPATAGSTTSDITVKFNLRWKEIAQ